MINKKLKLSSLAAFGLVVGTMGTFEAAAVNPASECVAPTSEQIESLFAQLDQAHQDMFNSISCEAQNVALKLAEQKSGQNSCKGLNACKSSQNDCKGKSSCKGKAPGVFKNKNEAIEVAKQASEQAEKRMHSMRG